MNERTPMQETQTFSSKRCFRLLLLLLLLFSLLLFSFKGLHDYARNVYMFCVTSRMSPTKIFFVFLMKRRVENKNEKIVQLIFLQITSPDNKEESHSKYGSFVVYFFVFLSTTIFQSELSKHTCRVIAQKTGLRLQTPKTKACTGVWNVIRHCQSDS